MKIWPPAGDGPGGEYNVTRLVVGKKEYKIAEVKESRIMPGDELTLQLDFTGVSNTNDRGARLDLIGTVLLGVGTPQPNTNCDADLYIDCYPTQLKNNPEYHTKKHIVIKGGKVSIDGGAFGKYDAVNMVIECSFYSGTRRFTIKMSGRFPWYTIVPNKSGAIYNYLDENDLQISEFHYLGEVLTSVEVQGRCPIYAFPCCDGKAFSYSKGKLASIEGNLFNALEEGKGFTNYFRGFFAGQKKLRINTFYTNLQRPVYKVGDEPNTHKNLDLSYFFYQCAKGPQAFGEEVSIYESRYYGVFYGRVLTAGEMMDKSAMDKELYGITTPLTLSDYKYISNMTGFYRGCGEPGDLFYNLKGGSGVNLSECFAESGITFPYDLSNISVNHPIDLSYIYSDCEHLEGIPSADSLPDCAADVQGMFQGCKNIGNPDASFAQKLVNNKKDGTLLLSGMFANSGIDDCSWAAPIFSYSGPITAVSMFYNTKVKRADEDFWKKIPDRDDINVNRIFGACTELTKAAAIWETHENISASGAYEYCTSLADPPYSEIPEKYKVYDLELWNKKEEEEPT